MLWLSVRQLLSQPELDRVLVQARKHGARSYHSRKTLAAFLNSIRSRTEQPENVVKFTGHVRTIRNQKRMSFAKIGDGSTTEELQVVMEPSHAKGLGTGTAVSVTGHLRPCPPGLEQSHELHADKVCTVGSADPKTYPIQKKYHTNEYLRGLPHLRLRTPSNALLARLRSDCDFHISNYFRTHSYVRVHPPVITSSDCEGAGEVFSIWPQDKGAGQGKIGEFFRTTKYLTVSSQLHLEAYIHEHQAVWALSPTFRAERSDTPRHLSEFYMLEAELRSESLEELMDIIEELIRYVANNIEKSQVGRELLESRKPQGSVHSDNPSRSQNLRARFAGLRAAFWPRITYTRAVALLQSAVDDGSALFQHRVSWDSGLQLEHEKYLVSVIGQGKPVFVTHYPQHLKPFYMLPSNACSQSRMAVEENQELQKGSHRETVACFDLLLPEIAEVAGGSLREHRLGPLMTSMRARGLPTDEGESLGWYTDLRRWGSVPHGGFGLGFDRLLCYLSGTESVRDVVGWPRWLGRCDG